MVDFLDALLGMLVVLLQRMKWQACVLPAQLVSNALLVPWLGPQALQSTELMRRNIERIPLNAGAPAFRAPTSGRSK